VWALQWMNAMVIRYKEKYEIQAIDLSKAFDCVKRDKLMAIVQQAEIVNEDEKRMLMYLLSDTRVRVKIRRENGKYFGTTIGVPQGDALSPVLFIIYLEHIMREQERTSHFRKNSRDFVVQYADDTTLAFHQPSLVSDHRDEECRCAKCATEHIQQTLPVTMADYKMIMNQGKTEFETLERGRQEDIQIKFLGTKLNVSEEVKARKMRASRAMRVMRSIWSKHGVIGEKLRVRLYRACVEPHLLYNTATIPATDREIEALNKEHRRGLRIAIAVFYPSTIGNLALYDRTKTESITVRATKMRWELFGKILRGREDDAALRVMKEYYVDRMNRKKYRGGRRTTIATLLQMESQYATSGVRSIELGPVNTLLMLNRFQRVAKHRNEDKWKELTAEVVEAVSTRWRQREETRHIKRKTAREQREAKQDETRDEVRRREASMESEGVRQLREGQGGRSNHTQTSAAASAEGTQRRVHFEDERQR